MSTWKGKREADLLVEFEQRLRMAKTEILCMEDIGDALGDSELLRRVREVRDWIEAADRRARDLRGGATWDDRPPWSRSARKDGSPDGP